MDESKQATSFWSRVDVRNADDCWEWQGARTMARGGYGVVKIHRKQWRTHRLAWKIIHGFVPSEMQVQHTCDNPPCCNPSHLKLGTAKDNVLDMHKRGRAADHRGENHASSKLVKADILEIRRLYATGKISYSILGRLFKVSKMHICRIVNRERWDHI